jgi:hypothetical protein
LTREESCASGCAAWLAIVVGKQNPLFGDTVNAGGSAHHAIRIGTHIPHADVVPENDEDVRSLPGRGSRALLRLCCWTECKQKIEASKAGTMFLMINFFISFSFQTELYKRRAINSADGGPARGSQISPIKFTACFTPQLPLAGYVRAS